MIIWSGLGFLGILIPFATDFLTVLLVQTLFGKSYTDTHGWPVGVGILIGALCVYLLSVMLDKPGRALVDPATGQTVVLRKRHSLFWIPLKYVAALVAVLGVVMCFVKPSSI